MHEAISPHRLAVFSGVSRQHIYRLRRGTSDTTLRVMTALAKAAELILRRKVHIREMFELGDEE